MTDTNISGVCKETVMLYTTIEGFYINLIWDEVGDMTLVSSDNEEYKVISYLLPEFFQELINTNDLDVCKVMEDGKCSHSRTLYLSNIDSKMLFRILCCIYCRNFIMTINTKVENLFKLREYLHDYGATNIASKITKRIYDDKPDAVKILLINLNKKWFCESLENKCLRDYFHIKQNESAYTIDNSDFIKEQLSDISKKDMNRILFKLLNYGPYKHPDIFLVKEQSKYDISHC